jgi:uncharacterized protein YydD (DUF2326 family)
MFLKELAITSESKVIREIVFHKGINLIVDETAAGITGNSVGKTTVLKLIDFCLGANPKHIYQDHENKKQDYKLVKDFLINKKVVVTLTLTTDLDDLNAEEIVIQRNFLARKEIIRRINGDDYTEDEFELKLLALLFPNQNTAKPTFRQIISHNIRWRDESINNTLKTLDGYTSDAEYETLYLYLLGCEFLKGNAKQEILARLKQEESYKSRLEKNQTKTAYEATVGLINNDIEELNLRKSNLNLNENFEADLQSLNQLKYDINKNSLALSKLNIRRNLIIETEEELKTTASNIDFQQLRLIYEQASTQIANLQKTFEDLVQYHNQMISQKIDFISKELPAIESEIEHRNSVLTRLLNDEKRLANVISKSDSFDELEDLIIELNGKFQKKGEYENIIQLLEEVEDNIKEYNRQLKEIDDELFSDAFEQTVKDQLRKFNKFFATISNELYGEQYALKYDIVTNSKGQRLYKFNAFNTNLSSGKKQGEISCFDIAYIMFADAEGLPTLHFLLNDKKELMHDNQLVKIAEYVNKNNIQFVASILKDKLPGELNKEEFFVVKLSDTDKLFRVESN